MDVLSCSRSFVYTLIRAKKLETVKIGRLCRVTGASLDAFLDACREET
jgi:excisionase family DNA binding protein